MAAAPSPPAFSQINDRLEFPVELNMYPYTKEGRAASVANEEEDQEDTDGEGGPSNGDEEEEEEEDVSDAADAADDDDATGVRMGGKS